MSDNDAELERRLAAVERALEVDPDADPTPSPESSSADDLEARLTVLESRVDELDAAVQAVRGFLGGVSAVNESVERRADSAVAAVERLEQRLNDRDPGRAADGSEETTVDISGSGDADEPAADDGATASGECPDPGLRERLRGLR